MERFYVHFFYSIRIIEFFFFKTVVMKRNLNDLCNIFLSLDFTILWNLKKLKYP